MTTEAILFMVITWSLIGGMTGYCFWKLLTSDRQLGPEDQP